MPMPLTLSSTYRSVSLSSSTTGDTAPYLAGSREPTPHRPSSSAPSAAPPVTGLSSFSSNAGKPTSANAGQSAAKAFGALTPPVSQQQKQRYAERPRSHHISSHAPSSSPVLLSSSVNPMHKPLRSAAAPEPAQELRKSAVDTRRAEQLHSKKESPHQRHPTVIGRSGSPANSLADREKPTRPSVHADPVVPTDPHSGGPSRQSSSGPSWNRSTSLSFTRRLPGDDWEGLLRQVPLRELHGCVAQDVRELLSYGEGDEESQASEGRLPEPLRGRRFMVQDVQLQANDPGVLAVSFRVVFPQRTLKPPDHHHGDDGKSLSELVVARTVMEEEEMDLRLRLCQFPFLQHFRERHVAASGGSSSRTRPDERKEEKQKQNPSAMSTSHSEPHTSPVMRGPSSTLQPHSPLNASSSSSTTFALSWSESPTRQGGSHPSQAFPAASHQTSQPIGRFTPPLPGAAATATGSRNHDDVSLVTSASTTPSRRRVTFSPTLDIRTVPPSDWMYRYPGSKRRKRSSKHSDETSSDNEGEEEEAEDAPNSSAGVPQDLHFSRKSEVKATPFVPEDIHRDDPNPPLVHLTATSRGRSPLSDWGLDRLEGDGEEPHRNDAAFAPSSPVTTQQWSSAGSDNVSPSSSSPFAAQRASRRERRAASTPSRPLSPVTPTVRVTRLVFTTPSPPPPPADDETTPYAEVLSSPSTLPTPPAVPARNAAVPPPSPSSPSMSSPPHRRDSSPSSAALEEEEWWPRQRPPSPSKRPLLSSTSPLSAPPHPPTDGSSGTNSAARKGAIEATAAPRTAALGRTSSPHVNTSRTTTTSGSETRKKEKVGGAGVGEAAPAKPVVTNSLSSVPRATKETKKGNKSEEKSPPPPPPPPPREMRDPPPPSMSPAAPQKKTSTANSPSLEAKRRQPQQKPTEQTVGKKQSAEGAPSHARQPQVSVFPTASSAPATHQKLTMNSLAKTRSSTPSTRPIGPSRRTGTPKSGSRAAATETKVQSAADASNKSGMQEQNHGDTCPRPVNSDLSSTLVSPYHPPTQTQPARSLLSTAASFRKKTPSMAASTTPEPRNPTPRSSSAPAGSVSPSLGCNHPNLSVHFEPVSRTAAGNGVVEKDDSSVSVSPTTAHGRLGIVDWNAPSHPLTALPVDRSRTAAGSITLGPRAHATDGWEVSGTRRSATPSLWSQQQQPLQRHSLLTSASPAGVVRNASVRSVSYTATAVAGTSAAEQQPATSSLSGPSTPGRSSRRNTPWWSTLPFNALPRSASQSSSATGRASFTSNNMREQRGTPLACEEVSPNMEQFVQLMAQSGHSTANISVSNAGLRARESEKTDPGWTQSPANAATRDRTTLLQEEESTAAWGMYTRLHRFQAALEEVHDPFFEEFGGEEESVAHTETPPRVQGGGGVTPMGGGSPIGHPHSLYDHYYRQAEMPDIHERVRSTSAGVYESPFEVQLPVGVRPPSPTPKEPSPPHSLGATQRPPLLSQEPKDQQQAPLEASLPTERDEHCEEETPIVPVTPTKKRVCEPADGLPLNEPPSASIRDDNVFFAVERSGTDGSRSIGSTGSLHYRSSAGFPSASAYTGAGGAPSNFETFGTPSVSPKLMTFRQRSTVTLTASTLRSRSAGVGSSRGVSVSYDSGVTGVGSPFASTPTTPRRHAPPRSRSAKSGGGGVAGRLYPSTSKKAPHLTGAVRESVGQHTRTAAIKKASECDPGDELLWAELPDGVMWNTLKTELQHLVKTAKRMHEQVEQAQHSAALSPTVSARAAGGRGGRRGGAATFTHSGPLASSSSAPVQMKKLNIVRSREVEENQDEDEEDHVSREQWGGTPLSPMTPPAPQLALNEGKPPRGDEEEPLVALPPEGCAVLEHSLFPNTLCSPPHPRAEGGHVAEEMARQSAVVVVDALNKPKAEDQSPVVSSTSPHLSSSAATIHESE